jgi:4'-phosphopantetheinyl transferase
MNHSCSVTDPGGRPVDVWLTFYDEIEAGLLTEFRELLSQDERAQEGRFYFADDRKRYLVTRALVRTVLSRYLHVDPRRWRFEPDKFGRPHIKNVEALVQQQGCCAITFNISHTRGLIALAVSQGRDLGVDVENVLTRSVSTEIADRFFSPAEVEALHCFPKEHRQQRFFEYWTFKESYIKARGMGLSIPLDQFSFDYPTERLVRLTLAPELNDLAHRWHFWQFRPTAAHLLAACAERRSGDAPPLRIKRIVPMVMEETLHLPCLKASEPGCAESVMIHG